MKHSLHTYITEFSERAREHRRNLHRIPECGLELPKTNAYISSVLTSCGLTPQPCGKGIIADVGTSGPLIAIRADTDALPIVEETGLTFSSTHQGAMHACGHDAHAGVLLALAELMATHQPKGMRVRFLFQPGEEGYFGACTMIESGCLEGVSAITGLHVGDLSEELKPGQAGLMPGAMMALSDNFEGIFTGKGGHGSAPHHTLDPIPVLAEYIQAAYAWRSRALDQRMPCTLSFCSVHAGTAHNIIPGQAEFRGTFRTLSKTVKAKGKKELTLLAEHIAQAHGLSVKFSWIDGYPPLYNDPAASQLALTSAQEALGNDIIVPLSIPCMGGEDFAYYLEKVPGCFWFINTQNPENGITAPNHNSAFTVDESLLSRAMSLLIITAEAFAERYQH
ncbi:MAG TPA: amidohydrolase [Spirochaetia bacterium]|nr:amidohydrolase [Spirochaetales bacterium]HPD80050.1 amidohydrolase [Spirochaetales bacterium]HQK33673.1 amidohydrolase [Spirochaetales bacterium]HRS65651.1 amidohydrolase [Spirochaetia bacterium]HRV28172.1 amidohydrolase [Spirochaetia bacterium]